MQEYDDRHFKEIAAFLAVVETGSFAAAARRVGRDASILSRRITSLEARLGARLIERTTRRLLVTEAGQRLAIRMRSSFGAMAEAEEEVREAASQPTGLLRLALPSSFGRLWIAPILPSFLQRYPGVKVETRYADRYVDLVAEGIDAAVRIGDLSDSGLVSRKLADSRRLICASPAYLAVRGAPDIPADLATHACLAFTKMAGFPFWQFRRGEETARVPVSGPLLSDEPEDLLHAALCGHGVIMASEWVVGRQLAMGRLVELLPDWSVLGEGGVHLLRPSGRFTPAKVRVFADWIAAAMSPPPWRSRE